MSQDHTVTELLHAADAGDEAAFRAAYSRTYEELRRLARMVRSDRADATLDTTALVHEAYLKLAPGHELSAYDRVHFFRIAARAMRQVLIDAARRRRTRKDAQPHLEAEFSHVDAAAELSADVLALDAALIELEALNDRQARVVECRFFAGLSVEDTALALGVSAPTVKRDWRMARAWLARALHAQRGPAG